MTSEPVYFAQISDTHIGPDPGFSQRGHTSLACAQRLVDELNALPTRPDFIIHTGDVVAAPGSKAYTLAAETFSKLRPPVYFVNGNHDQAADIRKHLSMGPKEYLSDDPGQLAYKFEFKGYHFVVLDTRGPDEIDPRGLLPDAQLDFVRREVQSDGPPLLFFMHHPALPMNSIWMDAYMLILNGDALHEALLPARDRLRGVFYGHVHQNIQTVRDGILYVGVASAFSQFGAWPGDQRISFEHAHPPGYNFVHLLPDRMIIHQQTFERP